MGKPCSPSCLATVQPTITSSAQYVVTHNPQPQFLVDYGEKVQQLDPLQLFNITGTDRYAHLLCLGTDALRLGPSKGCASSALCFPLKCSAF